MPTPVDVARQCLAEAAAAVLDDAVAVAKRRSHAQTTSLHIVSALLSLPSSALREACTRARSNPYSPRLQFRALDLCVGVALDRVSVTKSAADKPPVSNSLMAAIKRSQANQRRHPETFHLYQQQLNSDSQNCTSIYAVKVEMKHFVMSILDDPIVSRVLSDAGFQTHELKMAIVNPLKMTRFPSSTSSRPPPLFPCSLSEFELSNSRVDDNSKRIGETLIKKSRRNPLLIGPYASDAHGVFLDHLKKGGNGVLPKEIEGVSLVSLSQEISEFFAGSKEETMGLKFKQVDEMVKDCQGAGIVVNIGDLKVFVDAESLNAVNYLVSEMKRLLADHNRKLWLVGFLGEDGDYKKLVERVQSIEMDWDLHMLPITTGEKCFKSSLLRSFVPLGGFFSMPSDNESTSAAAAKPSSSLCNACNQKCEQEVSNVSKGGVSTNAVADKASTSLLSSWMQIDGKRSLTAEVKEDKAVLDARVGILKRKWSDICRRLHSSSTSQLDITLLPKSHTSGVGSSLNRNRIVNISACMPSDLQRKSLPLQETCAPIISSGLVETQTNISGQGLELSLTPTPIASTSSVTTNLRLGTLYNPAEECTKKVDMRSESSTSHSNQALQSSSWCHRFSKTKDPENPWAALAEKVHWQTEAIQTISHTISRCRNGKNGNVWLSLVGPDKVGKRKIAAGIAEIVFGRKENLLSLDLNSEDVSSSSLNSIVDCYGSNRYRLNLGRQMIIDYLGQELRKHPHSVVLLENIDKADFLVRDSLSRAVKTGKFPDSHGRETIINNNVFLLASEDHCSSKVASEFPEEKILEAKNSQMQILLGSYTRKNATMNVSVTPCKRKLTGDNLTDSEMPKRARSIIDLNLPVEEMEMEEGSDDGNDNMEELQNLVDENVVFRPYDFDFLCQKILKGVDIRLKEPKIWVEIDREVMAQMLAAAWVMEDGESGLEDWIERVLCLSLNEAREKCSVGDSMRLVQCDGVGVEGKGDGIWLPGRVKIV